MDIVFMGTPDFAVPCLKALIDGGHNVVGVLCQPDRPKGRGKKLTFSPVKELALASGIAVYQPNNLKDPQVLATLESLNPQLMVVVAYGKILPESILNLPPLGCINIHGSILPRLRGAAPIQWSIIRGDSTTGITSMYMDKGMDTGDIILTRETHIKKGETSGELFARLSPMGAEVLIETVNLIKAGNATRTPQNSAKATYAPMIKKEDGLIDYSKSALEIYNHIRGMHPWPTAFTYIKGERVTIHASEVVQSSGKLGDLGEIIHDKSLIVACGSGSIKLTQVQLAGKKQVEGEDFVNGQRLILGDKFTTST